MYVVQVLALKKKTHTHQYQNIGLNTALFIPTIITTTRNSRRFIIPCLARHGVIDRRRRRRQRERIFGHNTPSFRVIHIPVGTVYVGGNTTQGDNNIRRTTAMRSFLVLFHAKIIKYTQLFRLNRHSRYTAVYGPRLQAFCSHARLRYWRFYWARINRLCEITRFNLRFPYRKHL